MSEEDLDELLKLRSCTTCMHDGQCDGLHRCGGKYWQSRFAKCAVCGEWINLDNDDWDEDDDGGYCHEACCAER